MPSTKEIRAKIRSVHNTRKITKAMEMVAASKMKKAQDRMRAARPYGNTIRNLIGHLADASTEAVHPFLRKVKEVNNIGLICVSTDKGLAGALNTNIQRLLAKVQIEAFQEGRVDVVYIAYSRFINAMKQEPVIEQLLPLPKSAVETDKHENSWDYIYEPSADEVLKVLLKRYVEALIYQAVAENMASEQSARMVAMKAASDNAKKLIDDLELVYNKTRQAGITKEITEIVGGAAAVS